MALELNDSIFEEKVLKSDKPVLVDFWAEWCGPCRMVGPIIDELSKDFEGKAVVGKIDVDANADTTGETMSFQLGQSEKLKITSDSKIGINASSPDCTLHVVKASAGTVSADGNAVLALENSNHCVLNMMSPADKSSYIMMGDPDDINAGQIRYDNNINNLLIDVNGCLLYTSDAADD